MIVERVHEEDSSHIEPPLDQSWPQWKKLEWCAAVTAADTGLPIRLVEGAVSVRRWGRWKVQADEFCIHYGTGQIGGFGFNECWAYLTGISTGARLATGRSET